MFASAARGLEVDRDLVLVRRPRVHLSGWVIAILWCCRRLGSLVWFAVRHPGLVSVVGLLWWLDTTGGRAAVVAVLCLWAVVLTVWGCVHRASFRRFVTGSLRSSWRRWWVYVRHWQPAMTLCGLSATYRGSEHLPLLRRVWSDPFRDRVTVRMLTGQTTHDWERQADALAQVFGAQSCRVRHPKPRVVVLELTRGDPLAEVVPAGELQEVCDLTAVPVGRTEAGQPWCLPLRGNHTLLAGATGAGKGSVLWSLVRALAPGVRDGLVQVWALDPKGGMELGPGAPLFSRFAFADLASMAGLLEDAVAVMDARAARLRGVARQHEPCPSDPLVVVLVDELASLTAYVTDRDLKRRIAHALSLLLSKGRAVGVLVVAALQDPRKDVLPFRDLFPVRVALRLPEREAADMVLGDHAHDHGARCDRIPTATPGVGYVLLDGDREPTRVRACWVADEDIRALAATHAPPAFLHPVPDTGNAA